jgi:hypothetical protein
MTLLSSVYGGTPDGAVLGRLLRGRRAERLECSCDGLTHNLENSPVGEHDAGQWPSYVISAEPLSGP